MGITIVDHQPGMIIGRGFDDATGTPKFSSAITGQSGVPDGQSGAKGSFDFVKIETRSDFEQAIDFSTSSSAGLGGFGASFKASYMEKCKLSTEATFCVIRFQLTNPVRTFLETPQFTEEANELLRLNKAEDFRRRFGTKCIVGLEDGAEMIATVRIESQDKAKQAEIRAKMEAQFGAFSANMEGGFEGIATSGEDEIDIHVVQTGGTVVPAFDLPSVMETVLTASAEAQNGQAFPHRAILGDYEDFKLPSDDVSFINLQHQRAAVDEMGESYRDLLVMLNDIEFVLRNQNFYKNPKVSALNKAAQQISAEMNRLVKAADTCLRNPESCELLTPVIPKIPMPERKTGSSSGGGVKVTEGIVANSVIANGLKLNLGGANTKPENRVTAAQLGQIAQHVIIGAPSN